MTDTLTINVPGRVIEFYMGGQAWIDFERGVGVTRDLPAAELALFTAVEAGKLIRPSKGGYYVKARLSPEAREAAEYWAETLASSVGDSVAEGEQWARNDLRAANRLLTNLWKAKRR